MPENRGYYEKFDVHRRDGRDEPGGDREGALYFTLDLVHDPYALTALRAYLEVAKGELPFLVEDLQQIFPELQHEASRFVLDRVQNPHPAMLVGAWAARSDGGDFWRGYRQAMVDATGSPPADLEAWMERNK
jgi:hypothetical protein